MPSFLISSLASFSTKSFIQLFNVSKNVKKNLTTLSHLSRSCLQIRFADKLITSPKSIASIRQAKPAIIFSVYN